MSLSVIGYLPLWLPSQRGRRPDARSSRRGRPRTRLGEIALAAPSLAAVEQVAEREQGRPEGEEGAEQTPGVPDPAEDGEDDHDADPCRDRPGDQLQPESRAHPVVAPFVGRRRRAARPLISYPPASPARVSLSPPPQSMAAAPAAMRLLLGSRTGISARSGVSPTEASLLVPTAPSSPSPSSFGLTSPPLLLPVQRGSGPSSNVSATSRLGGRFPATGLRSRTTRMARAGRAARARGESARARASSRGSGSRSRRTASPRGQRTD